MKVHLNRRLIIFLCAMALTEISRTMTLVQIPIFIREQLGASIQQLGFFLSISLIFPFLLGIFGGWLSDSIGRLRTLTLGSFAGMISFLAYALAPTWQIAILAPAFLAVTSSLVFPSYKAYIADQTSEDVQGRVFGITEAVIALAWIFGPPLGGLVAQQFGYRPMFALATITFTLATGIFFVMYRTSPTYTQERSAKPSIANLRSSLGQMLVLAVSGGLVTWILIVDGVRDIAFKMSFDLMPIYLREIGSLTKQEIGLLDGLFGVALILTTLPAGWLVDKTSERVGITFGLITMIVSRLVFAIASAFWGFALSWMLLGLGGGLLNPAASALIAKGVPRKVRGLTYALVATSLGIFSLPAPWIGSQVWNAVNPRAPFLLTVVLATLVLIPAWFKLVLKSKHWTGVNIDIQTLQSQGVENPQRLSKD
jgi:DHA1 family multidrug resistance protein-like MFS transporter